MALPVTPVWPLVLWILSVSWWVMWVCLNLCSTQERYWDDGIRPTLWRQLNPRVKERWFPRSKMDGAAKRAGEWTMASNDNKGQQNRGLCEHTNSVFGTWEVSAPIVWGHRFQFINKLFYTPVVSNIIRKSYKLALEYWKTLEQYKAKSKNYLFSHHPVVARF